MKHDKIESLSVRQQCRDKVSVWFGSRDNYYHAIKEVIANGADEIINNFEEGNIEVELFEDNKTISIEDSGRGIPIFEETNGKKNYQLLFETLFAGTKYSENENNTTGTNGVGLTVVNNTCELFKVISKYGGKKYIIEYENGGHLKETKEEECQKSEHGTKIIFKLDEEVYPKTIYDETIVRDIVKHFAVGSSKNTLTFKYGEQKESFHYDNIVDYFTDQIGNTSTSIVKHLPNTAYNEDGEITQVDLVLTTTPETIQESYLNLTYLQKGGTINKGVLDGVRFFVNKHCRDNKLFPKGIKAFNPSDVEDSISFVCNVLSNNVDFENQTKLSTEKRLYTSIIKDHTEKLMELMKIEDKDKFDKFVKHLLTIQKHNTVNTKARKKLKKALSENIDNIRNKVEKLVDCRKHGEESEVFIVEGKSALGSIIQARDPQFQAGYPLRGKFLNCLKANYSTIFDNDTVVELIKVLGCGVETDRKNKDLDMFDINNLRYGAINIACDADPDGFNIICLLLVLFYRLMRQVLEDGRLYIVQTPLYEVKLENEEFVYIYNESEKESKLAKIKGKYTISRLKGLGEMDAEIMAHTAMNPDTRKRIQVTVDDARKMEEAFDTWMDIDVENRKKFIEENLFKYVDKID